MVHVFHSLNFSSVIDDFFAARPLKGAHATLLGTLVRSRAQALLNHPDVRYVPTFKVLDLLADMVNHAAALDSESQLREPEARALLERALDDTSPRIHQFLLDAAIERARYEPMMILDTGTQTMREATLRKRWTSMRYAHQRRAKLPSPWIDIVDAAVEAAIHAPCFAEYRIGPLMQCFAEMLETARALYANQALPETLIKALSEHGTLWKRYALKPTRYRVKPKTLHHSEAPRPTLH